MKLLWLGDFYYDYDYISDDINELSDWICKNNYKTVLNLEGPIDSSKFNRIMKRGPNLSSTITAIEVLKKLNVIGVTMANNHMMDFGKEGLNHTIKLLNDNGILHTGAGNNIAEALKPMVINDNNESMAIYSFGWDVEETVNATQFSSGCAPLNKSLINNFLKLNKDKYSKNVICLHLGFEYNRLPMPYDIELCHSIIDSGGDLIIGNHPHCVQPKEKYKNKMIYYSLGNFYFSGRRSRFNKVFNEKIKNQSDYGIMVKCNLDLNVYDENIIEYNHNIKKSCISKVENSEIIHNLNDYEIYGKGYVSKVKKNKKNINPILTLDSKGNKKKLNILFFRYKLKQGLKSFLKTMKLN